jgi:hypothetical protein
LSQGWGLAQGQILSQEIAGNGNFATGLSQGQERDGALMKPGRYGNGANMESGKELRMLHDCVVPEVPHRILIMKAPMEALIPAGQQLRSAASC